jgi:hypothetical protein
MQTPRFPDSQRYARILETSRRVRWDIDRDVIRGRGFDTGRNFMPPGLSLADELDFLSLPDRRLFSQVQGRSYAYLFGLCERYIAAKVLDVARDHGLGDQVALQALVGMGDEELKHQELFRRLERMMDDAMPAGYVQAADPNEVARAILAKGTWAVMALTLHIELFTLAHYRASIGPEASLCPLWKDVFLFHWKEESQHAQLDEMEFLRIDATLTSAERDAGVGELIELVVAVDGLLQAQAAADARYFTGAAETRFDAGEQEMIAAAFLKAYRWQYIVSGVLQPRFQQALFGTLDVRQRQRIESALAPLLANAPAQPARATA